MTIGTNEGRHVALKKSDLYRSLWSGADDLRGGMDASQYKDYVLTLLFVKYVSDKAKADPHSLIEVPEGGSFDDLVKLKGQDNIGEQVNTAIRALGDANDLQGVINNADFDDSSKLGDGKAKVDRLSSLIGIFQDLDFTGSRAEGDDLLGDAYEYLMRNFATESGKSKGQFYTPAEVSRVMAQLLAIKPDTPRSTTVYDPTCGSGSLLIKVADAAPNGLTIYGQEMDNATWALSRMNMFLHGYNTHDIRQGNTLADPKFLQQDRLQTFHYLVANPPFSWKSWTHGMQNDHGIFEGYGRPPEKNGDFAFLLHMLKSLNSTGKAAIILPHGVLFRGNAEATIRKEIIKRGYIKGVIGLPQNLFYGTGIPACLMIIDKENAVARTGIFMIDASRGFEKDGPKNRLRPRDMHKVIDVFTRQAEVDRYSRMVPMSEIQSSANNFNLNIARYIDSSEPDDLQDLVAHVQGGIPNVDLDALEHYWEAFPSLRAALFGPLREGYSELGVGADEVENTITDSVEYVKFCADVDDQLVQWWMNHRPLMASISSSTRPNDLAVSMSDDLLERYRPRPLIDEYGVYEQLMQYWNNTMHDDVALVVGEGWLEASRPREARVVGQDNKGKPRYEDADLTFGTRANTKRWVMDLIPPYLIVNRYFPEEKARLDELTVVADAAKQAILDYAQERAIEEGPLFEAADDDGKVSSKLAYERLKDIKNDGDEDEVAAITHLISLFKAEASAKKSAKDASDELDAVTFKQYGQLTEGDVQTLVIDDKWLAAVSARLSSEVANLISTLVSRTETLGRRYAATSGQLEARVEDLAAVVADHLRAMGVEL